MPVFRENESPPHWCELESFAIVAAAPGAVLPFRRAAAKERLLVTRGNLQLALAGRSQVYRDGQFIDIAGDSWEVRAGAGGAEFVSLRGHWGEELGGCGVFSAVNVPNARDVGDPVAYPKFTSIDAHYHDCDEYWIMLEGEGTVVVGGRHFAVTPGDCIPIGMGHHHDMPVVATPVRAVYFETTLQGRKRTGHLWNHTHGPAEPMPGRI